MRVKICGICRPEDARCAVAAGADYIGVILHGDSPRRRSLKDAADIYAAAVDTKRVGVFVDAPEEAVRLEAERLRLDIVQLHGGESAAYVKRIRDSGPWRVWKALRPRVGMRLVDEVLRYHEMAHSLLIDGWSAERAGGTGTPFPWADVAATRAQWPAELEFVAAGGLDPDNVGDAVRRLLPDIVDVSSGVEEEVGRKSPELMRSFVREAREASADTTNQADVNNRDQR